MLYIFQYLDKLISLEQEFFIYLFQVCNGHYHINYHFTLIGKE